ncbi:MAG: MCE family protein [Kiritimatiellae bacterium]|nr:MCE family protein [Kiritimatiellia bacterium]
MKKSGDVFTELTVGVFMLAVIALLAYFTIVISGVDFINGRQKVKMHATFANVGGLKERDNVMYRGMKVGTVDSIDLAQDGARLVLSVEKDVVMRETGRLSIASLSLLGGNYLLLEEGQGEALPLESTDFTGETPSDWMQDLGAIAKNLNEITSGDEVKSILANADAAAASVRALAERIEKGEGSLGKLLSPDETAYNDLKATLASASAAAENLKTLSARLEAGEGLLGKMLAADDGGVYSDAQAAVKDLREIAAEAKDSIAGVKAAIANAQAFTERLNREDTLVGKLTGDEELARSAGELVANLEKFSATLNSGEGTLGKLLTDPALHNDISGLVKDLRQIVDNYRDTTPITTFGTLATGAL